MLNEGIPNLMWNALRNLTQRRADVRSVCIKTSDMEDRLEGERLEAQKEKHLQ